MKASVMNIAQLDMLGIRQVIFVNHVLQVVIVAPLICGVLNAVQDFISSVANAILNVLMALLP